MIVRYRKDDNYPPSQLIGFLEEHVNGISELSCEETLQDSDIALICETLRVPQASLQTLRLPRNGISIRGAESIARLLCTNQTISKLDLRHNQLGPTGVATLIQPLISENVTLRVLCLKNNQLTHRASSSIKSLIQHCKSLEELNLTNNSITHRGIGRFMGEISSSCNLKTLYLAHNHLGSQGIARLVKDLRAGRHNLEFLDLTCNQAGNKGMHSLLGMLLYDQMLQKLWLASNDFGAPCGGMLSSILRHNHTLVELRLGGNQLGNEGAVEISKGLLENNSLVRLEIDWNQIGDVGASGIAEALTKNGKLLVLDLNGNHISREGGVALAQALPYHLQLRELHLDHNRLDDEAALEFEKSLISCGRNLQLIQCESNNFSEQGLKALEQGWRFRSNCIGWLKRDLQKIQRNEVTTLNWLHRRFGDAEVEKISMALSNSQKLTCIYLGGPDVTSKSLACLCRWMESSRLKRFYLHSSKIGDDGASLLGTILKRNECLEVLSITSSRINVCGAEAIAEGLQINSTLSRLNLGKNLLRDAGCLAIGQALRGNISLKSLNLMSNQIQGLNAGIWEALVGSNVCELQLNDNLLTDESIIMGFALALVENCPFHIVNLSGNDVSRKGIQVLKRCLNPTTSLHI